MFWFFFFYHGSDIAFYLSKLFLSLKNIKVIFHLKNKLYMIRYAKIVLELIYRSSRPSFNLQYTSTPYLLLTLPFLNWLLAPSFSTNLLPIWASRTQQLDPLPKRGLALLKSQEKKRTKSEFLSDLIPETLTHWPVIGFYCGRYQSRLLAPKCSDAHFFNMSLFSVFLLATKQYWISRHLYEGIAELWYLKKHNLGLFVL